MCLCSFARERICIDCMTLDRERRPERARNEGSTGSEELLTGECCPGSGGPKQVLRGRPRPGRGQVRGWRQLRCRATRQVCHLKRMEKNGCIRQSTLDASLGRCLAWQGPTAGMASASMSCYVTGFSPKNDGFIRQSTLEIGLGHCWPGRGQLRALRMV